MADLDMSVTLSRTYLGLADLEVNNFDPYYVGPQFLGGSESRNRIKASSPYYDGDAIISSSLQNVDEVIGVEIYAESITDLMAKEQIVRDAFRQNDYVVTVTIDGTVYLQLKFYAADVQRTMAGPRLVAHQALITFNAPRHPIPLAGVI